jgi:tellurite resistance protein TerC
MESVTVLWVVFGLVVAGMLALDLGVLHRHAHSPSLREALGWSIAWITLALAFNAGVYVWRGPEPALQFLTGYLIEKALSVDNVFVFLVIFGTLGVPPAVQHRVLFWGVLGALVLRGVFIGAGTWLLARAHWIIYVFGAFLVVTAVRMARHGEAPVDPAGSRVLRWFRRVVPLTTAYHGDRFAVRVDGRWVATPLLAVLVLVETTDVVFALDSIPAIFAITTDPFIVFTSNVFAILGLRALYFVLAESVRRLAYLHLGLAVILAFVGAKMLLSGVVHIPIGISLAVVGGVLAVTVAASLLRARQLRRRAAAEPPLPLPVGPA